ncbi:MAG: hypothetical protein PUK75_12920 [bacterium]|nr:hypothetical protein [bacterium]MDY4100556.1 hypothetical protein [Lachnospiraceae bacterium]
MAGSMAISGYGSYGAYQPYAGAYSGSASITKNTNIAGQPAIQGNSNAVEQTDGNSDKQVKAGRKSSPGECQTCKERKYQDGSNESDVSFKAPGHISPQASAGTVRAHEQQHVSNAYQKAAQGNGKVISATVSIHTAICPECGTAYVAGGETRTAIAYSKENPYQKNQKAVAAANLIGANVDYVA